jgi:Domain of unknown function (DUF4136)
MRLAAESPSRVLAIASVLAFVLQLSLEAVDVRVDYDKTFDFKPLRTWAWNPQEAGSVKMARTQDDDPAAIKVRVEPWILDAVGQEMPRRGLQPAQAEPDVMVTYYMLLTTSMNAQTMGQFLPPTVAWGLPPFAQATQSIEMMNQGALVLDLSAKGNVVWRGVAQAKIAFEADDKKRETLVRTAIRDLLKRFPPKK